MTAINYARKYWRQLQDRGYRLVEIAPGKKNNFRGGWQLRALTPEEVESPEYDGGWGVGILAGRASFNIVGLDFDLPDEKLAADVYERACRIAPQLASLPKRIGQAPKFLLVARTEEPLAKSTSRMWTSSPAGTPEKECTKFRFEVLADGQQFVVFATHPATGRPYTWEPQDFFEERTSPLDTDADEWPVISVKEIEALRAMVDEECAAHGLRPLEPARSTSLARETDPAVVALMPALPPLGLTPDEARMLLREAGYDMVGRQEWLEALMALKHEFQNREAEGLALAVEVSQWADETVPGTFKGADDVKRTWDSLKRNGVRCVTMRTVQARARRSGSLRAAAEEPSAAGLAAHLIVERGERLVYLTDTKKFLSFNGVRWVQDDTGPLTADEAESMYTGMSTRTNIVAASRDLWFEHVRAHLPPPAADAKEEKERAKNPWVKLYNCLSNKPGWTPGAVRDYVQKSLLLRRLSSDFDRIPGRFAVANGSIDLRTGRFCPPSPTELISKGSPVRYVEGADCPTWKRCVLEWQSGREEDARYLQKYVGYTMLRCPREQVVHFFVGYGANGKSAFIDIMQLLMGNVHFKQISKAALLGSARFTEPSNVARPELLRLKDSCLAVCSETDEGSRLKAADLKALTGESTLTVRGLYSDFVTFPTTWNILIVTNFMPQVTDLSDGLFRRLRILRFDQRFSRDSELIAKGVARPADIYLYDRLKAELPGILNWAIEGARMYLEEGLEMTPAIRDNVREYRADQDFLQNWFDECTEPCDKPDRTNRARRDPRVFFDSWRAYTRRNAVPELYYSQQALSRQLTSRMGVAWKKSNTMFATNRMLKLEE